MKVIRKAPDLVFVLDKKTFLKITKKIEMEPGYTTVFIDAINQAVINNQNGRMVQEVAPEKGCKVEYKNVSVQKVVAGPGFAVVSYRDGVVVDPAGEEPVVAEKIENPIPSLISELPKVEDQLTSDPTVPAPAGMFDSFPVPKFKKEAPPQSIFGASANPESAAPEPAAEVKEAPEAVVKEEVVPQAVEQLVVDPVVPEPVVFTEEQACKHEDCTCEEQKEPPQEDSSAASSAGEQPQA